MFQFVPDVLCESAYVGENQLWLLEYKCIDALKDKSCTQVCIGSDQVSIIYVAITEFSDICHFPPYHKLFSGTPGYIHAPTLAFSLYSHIHSHRALTFGENSQRVDFDFCEFRVIRRQLC